MEMSGRNKLRSRSYSAEENYRGKPFPLLDHDILIERRRHSSSSAEKSPTKTMPPNEPDLEDNRRGSITSVLIHVSHVVYSCDEYLARAQVHAEPNMTPRRNAFCHPGSSTLNDSHDDDSPGDKVEAESNFNDKDDLTPKKTSRNGTTTNFTKEERKRI